MILVFPRGLHEIGIRQFSAHTYVPVEVEAPDLIVTSVDTTLVLKTVLASCVTYAVWRSLDETIVVIAGPGGGLVANRLQAELRTMTSKVCKATGVDRVVGAWRSCNAGRVALLCTITV